MAYFNTIRNNTDIYIMIHEAYSKSEIARRYYLKKGKELTKEQARKNFASAVKHKTVDKYLLLDVLTEILQEQIKTWPGLNLNCTIYEKS